MQKEHGLFNIKVEENLLLVQFFGAWNHAQAQHYNQEAKLAATPLLNQPWARIIDLSQWEGGGEETIAPIANLHQWSQQHNCFFAAYINPPLVPQFMIEKYGNLYGGYDIFQSTNEAKAWIRVQMQKHK
jgi:hypothetical protein